MPRLLVPLAVALVATLPALALPVVAAPPGQVQVFAYGGTLVQGRALLLPAAVSLLHDDVNGACTGSITVYNGPALPRDVCVHVSLDRTGALAHMLVVGPGVWLSGDGPLTCAYRSGLHARGAIVLDGTIDGQPASVAGQLTGSPGCSPGA